MMRITYCCCLVLASVAAFAEENVVAIKNDWMTVAYDVNKETFTVLRGDRVLAEGERFFSSGGDIQVRVEKLDDALGTGLAIVENDAFDQAVWLMLYDALPFLVVKQTFTNPMDDALPVEEFEPVALYVKPEQPAEAMRLLGCDGLTPATEARAGYTFLAMATPEGRDGCVLGWLTQRRGSGIAKAEFDGERVQLVGDTSYGGKLLAEPGKLVEGELLAFGCFDDVFEGLERYADAMARANGVALKAPPTGYCTWYHAGALDEKRMAKLAEFCEAQLAPYGFGLLQIDDKWQVSNRDFTTHRPDGPYPGGMKPTAETIHKHGFDAGIWLIPFGWDHACPALADHPEWFVHREDGSIYNVHWAGDCLDMTHPDARAFLEGVVRRIVHEWGYDYLKIDGLWTGMAVKILYPEPDYRDDGLGDAVFHDPKATNVEAYRGGLELVREAAGPGVFLLGCNIAQNMRTLGASVGLVDGMRVGRDIGPKWDRIVPCAAMGSRLYFFNGRVWFNDPDCLLVRKPLTLEQARAWGAWIAVTGQMNLVSEWLPRLEPDRLDIVKRSMSTRVTKARPLDLFANDPPRVWHDAETGVLGLFNWDAESPAEIAFTPEARVAGFDFWAGEFIPAFEGERRFQVPPSACRVMALESAGGRPAVLATSRHVAWRNVAEEAWDADAGVLRGVSEVVAGDPLELRIWTPAEWRADSADAEGAAAELDANGAAVRVQLEADKTGPVAWRVHFECK